MEIEHNLFTVVRAQIESPIYGADNDFVLLDLARVIADRLIADDLICISKTVSDQSIKYDARIQIIKGNIMEHTLVEKKYVIKFMQNTSDSVIPTKANDHAAGFDLYSREDRWLFPLLGKHTFDTGIAVEIPGGWMGMITGRSGNTRRGKAVQTGIIDNDYRGSLGVTMYCHGLFPKHIRKGDRIAQLVIYSLVENVDAMIAQRLSETQRGSKGFGSTGR